MNFFFLPVFLSISLLFGFGQNVLKPGFEAWIDYGNYEDPKNRQSPNFATSGLGVFTVTKSMDVHSVNYSVRMESRNILVGYSKFRGRLLWVRSKLISTPKLLYLWGVSHLLPSLTNSVDFLNTIWAK